MICCDDHDDVHSLAQVGVHSLTDHASQSPGLGELYSSKDSVSSDSHTFRN